MDDFRPQASGRSGKCKKSAKECRYSHADGGAKVAAVQAGGIVLPVPRPKSAEAKCTCAGDGSVDDVDVDAILEAALGEVDGADFAPCVARLQGC